MTRRLLSTVITALAIVLYLVELPLSRWLFDSVGLSRVEYNWAVQLVAAIAVFGAASILARQRNIRGASLVGTAALSTVLACLLIVATGWLAARLTIPGGLLGPQAALALISVVWAIEAVYASRWLAGSFSTTPTRS